MEESRNRTTGFTMTHERNVGVHKFLLQNMHLETRIYISEFYTLWLLSSVMGHTISSRTYRTEQACNYLTNDGSQFNAYSNSKLNGGFCCFCPSGTEWKHDCSPSNPSSTDCKICDLDHYIDFEPHIEPKCYPKRKHHDCHFPKVYHKGSVTESDKCLCPDGMDEDKITGRCKSTVAPTMPSTVSPKPDSTGSEAVSTETTYPDISVPIEVVTTADVSLTSISVSISAPGHQKIVKTPDSIVPKADTDTDIVTTDVPTAVDTHLTNEKGTDEDDTPVAVVWTSVVVVVLILSLCFILSLWIRSRKSNTKDSSDPSSSTTRLNDNNSTNLIEDPGMNVPSPNSSPRQSTVRYVAEETPLLDNGSAHSPCSRNDDIENANPSSSILRKKAEKFSQEDYHPFARKIAEKIGLECDRNHVMQIFRRILENVPYSNELQDIQRNHQSTKEMFYECMNLAIRYIGIDLSPLFIWEKIGECGFKHYTDIVADEIENFSKTSVGSEECNSSCALGSTP